MNRSDWLLLLLDKVALDVDGPDSLDPVRIQKGMFLLSKRGPAPEAYHFKPYNWGPFSRDVYADLDALQSSGLISAQWPAGQNWARYEPTQEGHARAAALVESLDEAHVTWMREARAFLTTRSFSRLLEDVYELFPEYATQSHFRRASA
jgi:uncharacterized protein YwgA